MIRSKESACIFLPSHNYLRINGCVVKTRVGRIEIRRRGERIEKRQRTAALTKEKVVKTAVMSGRIPVGRNGATAGVGGG